MKVSKDSVVSLEYRLHLGDGQVVDESEPGQPLAYMHGRGQIVPGLEGQLEGMSAGESKKVVVPPSQGYGDHDPRGLQEVPREMFPPNANLQAGLTISASTSFAHDFYTNVLHHGREQKPGEEVRVARIAAGSSRACTGAPSASASHSCDHSRAAA